MAKEKNTFREDVISTQEAGPSGSEPHPVHGARRATERVKISKCDISADKHYQQRSHLPISSQSAAMNVAVKLSTGQQSVSPLGKTQVNSSHYIKVSPNRVSCNRVSQQSIPQQSIPPTETPPTEQFPTEYPLNRVYPPNSLFRS
ncbi:uncharacterized protein LOC121864590 [Homarus americanus]|uniref:uncharacterized protein LOC121864590 n=1 Tax=Homarus americanus TaxID=6706 RepID=UPI001C46C0FC|nr:uncharacterized protein LOC121864590 [Homarus americanus]